jgi:hypothetical protein
MDLASCQGLLEDRAIVTLRRAQAGAWGDVRRLAPVTTCRGEDGRASGMGLPKFSRVTWSGPGPPRMPVSSAFRTLSSRRSVGSRIHRSSRRPARAAPTGPSNTYIYPSVDAAGTLYIAFASFPIPPRPRPRRCTSATPATTGRRSRRSSRPPRPACCRPRACRTRPSMMGSPRTSPPARPTPATCTDV